MSTVEEASSRPSRYGSVVLDIGGQIGALVIYTSEGLRGSEIEIALASNGRRTHTAVRERLLPDGAIYAGVFPALPAGDYILQRFGPMSPHHVTITGGLVSELDLVHI